MRRSSGIVAVAMTGVLLASCGGTPSGPSISVTAGAWGGDHLAMTVASGGAHLEFDCAHGDISVPLFQTAQGRFSVAGVYVREHGGPIRQGEPVDSHPAQYSGEVVQASMSLTVRLTDTGETIGSFALKFGVPGRVVKCL